VGRLLAAPEQLRAMGQAARKYAQARPFAQAAGRMAELLAG
jgi:hypothetical protein